MSLVANSSAANWRILLVRRPDGVPQAADFAEDEVAVPDPGNGAFVVRNLYLSVDPAQRAWATTGTHYAPPTPLGSVMRALAVGQVVASRNPAFQDGAYVYGWF